MKILLQGRVDVLQRNGGDSRIIADIRNGLVKRGIDCDINLKGEREISSYDLAHFFGIMRVHDLYPVFRSAKKTKVPTIVTPIYEDLNPLDRYGRTGIERIVGGSLSNIDLKELLKGFYRSIKDTGQLKLALLQLRVPYTQQQRELISNAHILFLSSTGETRALESNFDFDIGKVKTIPLGIEVKSATFPPGLFVKKYGIKDFILCVGRIEPKKNQLGVLTALAPLDLPLVFIGNLNTYHRAYGNDFKRRIKQHSHILYLGEVERPVLLSAYAAAKVHVLASWFEVVGLVSLEAALNGCNIVTTGLGYTREYLGDLAWYCDPRDERSIRRTVYEAYVASPRLTLRRVVEANYDWDLILPRVIKTYREVLN